MKRRGIGIHPMLAMSVIAGMMRHGRTLAPGRVIKDGRPRNVYRPGGGDKERARRRRQIAAGMIQVGVAG